MKYNSHVRILTDRSWERYHVGRSLESIAQGFCLNTTLIRTNTEEQLKLHGHSPASPYHITVLSCHGHPQKDGPVQLDWEVGRPVNAVEWETVTLHLTADDVPKYFTNGSGILINIACWSGERELAQAFLKVGYRAYIAPRKTSDCFSAYQFYAALLGYLLYEERDEKPQTLTERECVEHARRIDDLWDGANGFTIHEHTPEPAGPGDALQRP